MVKDEKQLLSVQEAAKYLGVTKAVVTAMVKNEQLKALTVGSKQLITKNSIKVLLGENISAENENKHGYLSSEELSSVLTKEDVGQAIDKEAETDMVYKGSISELKDGRFMVQIELGKKANGKRARESKGFTNRIEAEVYLEKRLKELNNQIQTSLQTMISPQVSASMNQYTTLTVEQYAFDKLTNDFSSATTRTIEGYRGGIQRLMPYIGKIRFAYLTKQDINKALKELSFTYADGSLKKSFSVMKMLVNEAVEEGDIPKDIMRKLRCPKSQVVQDKPKYEIYTDEDLAFLLETTKQHNKKLFTIFSVLSCTGMRPGELRALEWSDFNEEEKTIHIKQAATRKYEDIRTLDKAAKSTPLLSVTKSGYSVRTLTLTDLAVEALCSWREYIGKSRNKKMANSRFIFPDRQGNFTSDDSLKCLMSRYREKYGLIDDEVTYYKFRHTMCTKWILAGLPFAVIQNLMGDNSMRVIMDIYTHIDKKKALAVAQPFYDELNKQYRDLM